MIEIKTYSKPKKTGGSGGSSSSTKYISGVISEAEHAGRADKAKRAEVADQANYAGTAASAQNAAYASEAGNLHADAEILQQYLSLEDTVDPQVVKGMVIFAKGLIAKALVDLEMGAKFGNNAKITNLGEAVFSVIKSLDYDNAAEQGFSVEKEKSGKYHAFFTNLTIWGKARFHELEVRKLSYSGGNIYLSGAGSKLIKVVPVKKLVSADGVTTWVEMTKDDAESECAGWKCYLLADNGTTATMNDWQEGDQARCQTMGEIAAGGAYSDVSNKSYWRTIPNGGVSTQNEKIYGTKTETYLDEDGNEQTREVQVELYDGQAFAWIVIGKHGELDGYDDEFSSVGYNGSNPAPLETRDIPSAGDTIVLDGNRHRNEQGEYDKTDRQNVIILETTGEYAPRIACYANITEYKHTITKRVNDSDKEVSLSVFETSPKGGTKINSSRFEWISDDGSTINIINYRGDWDGNNTYHKNDQVNHNNAVWVCVANSGVDVQEKPSDGATYWKKVLSGGKGEKGDDAVSYGIQFSERITTISSVETKVLGVRFIKSVGQQITSGSIKDIDFNGRCVVYIDGVRNDTMTNRLNSGQTYLDIYHAFADEIKGKKGLSVELRNSDAIVVASNTFSFVESGEGVVMAYKNATSRPSKPTVEDLSQLSDGWSRTPQKGGSHEKVSNVSYGNYSAGNTDSGYSTSEWSEVSDGGETWRKSPAGLGNSGWALMKVSFTTNVDNSDVKFIIKAYSEYNCDFIQVHALDTEITGSPALRLNGVFNESGNGVESTHSFTSVKAGQHFFYVSYCKDVSINSNGDYGLFRFDLSDNLASMPSKVWMSQAVLKEGKAVLPWSTPVQITGDDAYRVVVSPSALIFDTDDNGRVAESSLSEKTATIRVYQGDKDVSDQFSKYDRLPSNKYNCNGSLKDLNKHPFEIQVTQIETQDVTTEGQESTISKTNGFLEFILTNGSENVTAHVDVQVNVAKFTGQMVNTNKQFSKTLQEISTKVDDKVGSSELTQFKAEITQTAREISLSVSEKSVGRRNMLVGSACRKYGDGFMYMSGGYYDGYPLEQIEKNSGIDGVNCIHCRTKQTGTSYFLSGFRWNGNSPQGNIKLDRGKNYVLSFYAKTNTPNDIDFIAEVLYQGSKIDTSRPAGYDGPTGYNTTFSASEADKWELFTVKVSVPSDAPYEYVEINIFARARSYSFVGGYICKPMLEKGENYNGWTLSEQDYDYVGGNLLDNARTLDKSGTLVIINDTVIQNGYGTDSACIKNLMQANATLSDYKEVLRWIFGSTYLVNGNDYIFSFVAKADVDDARVVCYMWSGDSENSCDIFTEGNGGTWDSLSDGNVVFILSRQWKRYWVHWRPNDGYATPKEVIIRHTGNNSTSASTVYVTQPKLEIGATMTEWTERKTDLVDKASLKSAGILVDAESVTLYGNQVHIKKNKTDANDTVLIDNETGKVSAGLIDADKVVAKGIKTQELEAQHLNVTGNSRLGIFEIHTATGDDRDEYTVNGDSIKYSGSYMFPDGKTEASGAGSFLTYKPMFIRQGAPDGYEYMRLGHQFTEWDDGNISGGSKNYFFVGAAARYVCSGDVFSCTRNVLPVTLKYNSDIKPAAYIYSVLAKDSAAFAIYTQAVGTAGERLAIQTNGAIRCVEALNIETIYRSQQISSGIGAARCVNTAEITIRLPINPVVGQKFYVLQEDTGKVNITGDSNHQIILFNKSIVTTCNSNTKGQISIFIWSGKYWFGSFLTGIL